MPESRRVFISHTTKHRSDKKWAHKLAAGLRLAGTPTWIAPDDIPAGVEWEEELVRAGMLGCSHFLVLLTDSAAGSGWVLREIKMALDRRAHDKAFRILRVEVQPVPDYPYKPDLDRLQSVPCVDDLDEQMGDQVALVLKALAHPTADPGDEPEGAAGGFDGYRAAVAPGAGPAADRLWADHRAVADAPAGRPFGEGGFVAGDRAGWEPVRDAVRRWLAAPDARPPGLQLLAAPFDEDPRAVAHWLAGELITSAGEWPVVAVVPLADLAPRADPSKKTDAERVADALRVGYDLTFPPTAVHVRAAMRVAGRLVVVAYAPPSADYWGNPAGWDDAPRDVVRRLERPPAGSGLAPQAVVVVCADDHHRAVWAGRPL